MTPEQAAAEARAALLASVDPVTDSVLAAWLRAYAVIRDDLFAAVADVAEHGDLTRAAFRTGPLGAAMNAASAALQALVTESVAAAITAAEPVVVQGARAASLRLVSDATARGMGYAFNTPQRGVLDAIVRRTADRIAAAHPALSDSAETSLRVNLVRAVAAGSGPRDAAARMLAETRGVFGGGLTRALVLARTELVDAHRAGSAATREANPGIVTGWRWSAKLDKRTCPACWAMHNTAHPNSEPLEGHQQCRCVPVPILRWDGPEDGLGDPAAAFSRLSPAEQRQAFGPARVAALNAGVPFSALAQRRPNEGWRHGHYATPVSALPVP